MSIKRGFTYALVMFFFTSVANASFFGLEPGWPRLVDNNTKINASYEGITAHFKAENAKPKHKGSDPYFKQSPGTPRVAFKSPKFSTWADIRVRDDGLEVLDGLFEVYGTLELDGKINKGLAFSASLIDVAWDAYTIAFKMESDQQGYLCDLGFCSFGNELLAFNLKSGKLDGNFTDKNFEFEAQTLATVPVPAAVWLFGTAIIALAGLRRSDKASGLAIS